MCIVPHFNNNSFDKLYFNIAYICVIKNLRNINYRRYQAMHQQFWSLVWGCWPSQSSRQPHRPLGGTSVLPFIRTHSPFIQILGLNLTLWGFLIYFIWQIYLGTMAVQFSYSRLYTTNILKATSNTHHTTIRLRDLNLKADIGWVISWTNYRIIYNSSKVI